MEGLSGRGRGGLSGTPALRNSSKSRSKSLRGKDRAYICVVKSGECEGDSPRRHEPHHRGPRPRKSDKQLVTKDIVRQRERSSLLHLTASSYLPRDSKCALQQDSG